MKTFLKKKLITPLLGLSALTFTFDGVMQRAKGLDYDTERQQAMTESLAHDDASIAAFDEYMNTTLGTPAAEEAFALRAKEQHAANAAFDRYQEASGNMRRAARRMTVDLSAALVLVGGILYREKRKNQQSPRKA